MTQPVQSIAGHKMLSVESNGIPGELKQLARFCVWKIVFNKQTGNPAKMPFCATDGSPADTTNRAHWVSFEVALARYHQGGHDGIGFCFFPEDGLVGVDFDDCYDDITKSLQPWV